MNDPEEVEDHNQSEEIVEEKTDNSLSIANLDTNDHKKIRTQLIKNAVNEDKKNRDENTDNENTKDVVTPMNDNTNILDFEETQFTEGPDVKMTKNNMY